MTYKRAQTVGHHTYIVYFYELTNYDDDQNKYDDEEEPKSVCDAKVVNVSMIKTESRSIIKLIQRKGY